MIRMHLHVQYHIARLGVPELVLIIIIIIVSPRFVNGNKPYLHVYGSAALLSFVYVLFFWQLLWFISKEA